MKRGRRGVGGALAGCLAAATIVLGIGSTASAGLTVPAGFDLFETDPGTTQFMFQDPFTGIPQDFFGPGSDPFQGQVRFGGVPLETFNGKLIGDTDTIVRRPNSANPNPTAVVPIELVALNLVSVEPIIVTYNGGQNPEPWQINAAPSPTAQSAGQMAIDHGGTFDSTFRVIPKLIFTRISDGAVRDLDAGNLPAQTQNMLTFNAQNVPWSPGCKLPALAVTGLNDGFCPGLVPTTGRKKLTIEQAQLAQHGVYPAQPMLEHFRCYRVERQPFQPRTPTLTDQFGTRTADIPSRAELCNPVKKNQEPWQNRRVHLQCYTTTGQPVGVSVAVQNQFGSQRMRVGKPRRLCVPGKKRLLSQQFRPIQVPVDHFQCYSVTPTTPLGTPTPVNSVRLKDQFREETVNRLEPFQLCAPVKKRIGQRVTRVQHPVKHLVCYKTSGNPIVRNVEIRNQFETIRLKVVQPISLCVPTNKLKLP